MKGNREVLADCITALAEMFNRQLTPALLLGYELGLHGLSADQIKIATQRAMANSRFMPTPAELRHAIFGTPEERAERAWGVCVEIANRGGERIGIESDCPALHATIRAMGGWPAVFWAARGGDDWAHRRFVQTFAEIESHGTGQQRGRPLEPLDNHGKTMKVSTGLVPLENDKSIGSADAQRRERILPGFSLSVSRLEDENAATA